MSTVAMASLERSSLQMTAVVITQAEWLTCGDRENDAQVTLNIII